MPSGNDLLAPLAAVVGAALGTAVEVTDLRRLSGGASRETWSFDATRPDGVVLPLILRRDPPGATKAGMRLEAALLSAAGAAGVVVPGVITATDDPQVLGSSFLIMDRIEGETIARKLLRDDEYAEARTLVAGQCGEALARLHAVDPDSVAGLAETDQIVEWRGVLDALGEPSPAFELTLAWLEANRPVSARRAIVHGDFRNGNLIVDAAGLRSVLDWELSHIGDPLEDLGWFCVRAWRFGAFDKSAGGFGSYDQLVEAYEAASGTSVDRAALHWWETLGTLKWGIICMLQASAHLSGVMRSVELAAIGRRVCENEWDVLRCLLGDPALDERPAAPTPSVGIHGRPTALELVEAVREFLERDVMPGTEGRLSFHARVATNVLKTVERELAEDPARRHEHDADLAGLGVATEAELAAAIRAGTLDDRLADVQAAVLRTVRARLEVANPKHL